MLEEYDIFKNFSKQKLGKLVPAMLTVKYKRNIPVFKQGDPIDGLYMIKSGDFELKQEIMTEVEKPKPKVVQNELQDHLVLRNFNNKKIYKTKTIRILMASEGQMIGLEELCEWLLKVGSKTEQPKTGKAEEKKDSLKYEEPVRKTTLMALNDNCEVFLIKKQELYSNVAYQFNQELLKSKLNYLKSFREKRIEGYEKHYENAKFDSIQ